jgi:hypothetical protein
MLDIVDKPGVIPKAMMWEYFEKAVIDIPRRCGTRPRSGLLKSTANSVTI